MADTKVHLTRRGRRRSDKRLASLVATLLTQLFGYFRVVKLGVGLGNSSPLYPGPDHEGIHRPLDVAHQVPVCGVRGVGDPGRAPAVGELLCTEHLSALHCDGLTWAGRAGHDTLHHVTRHTSHTSLLPRLAGVIIRVMKI